MRAVILKIKDTGRSYIVPWDGSKHKEIVVPQELAARLAEKWDCDVAGEPFETEGDADADSTADQV